MYSHLLHWPPHKITVAPNERHCWYVWSLLSTTLLVRPSVRQNFIILEYSSRALRANACCVYYLFRLVPFAPRYTLMHRMRGFIYVWRCAFSNSFVRAPYIVWCVTTSSCPNLGGGDVDDDDDIRLETVPRTVY